jgi:hypothetical protein
MGLLLVCVTFIKLFLSSFNDDMTVNFIRGNCNHNFTHGPKGYLTEIWKRTNWKRNESN